jgi:hypothetical protein
MMETGQRVTKEQKTSKNAKSEKVACLDPETINMRIGFVFGFYKWAKETGSAPDFIIGTPTDGSKYLITAVEGKNGKWHWPYFLNNAGHKAPVIPTKDDLDDLHGILYDIFSPVVTSRNRLVAHWYSDAGLRGSEAASLTIELIPDYETIDNLLEKEQRYLLDFSPKRKGVSTKGNKSRQISVDPMLLKMTRDYIEFERSAIVEKGKALAKVKSQRYIEPKQVFLNALDGKAISAKTLQNEFSTACKKVGMGTAGHGLRKYHAMRIVSDIYLEYLNKAGGDISKIDVNTIILYAQQELGHSCPSTTIGHYLNLIKLKMLYMSDACRIELYNRRKEIIDRELKHAELKLKTAANKITQFDGLFAAIKSGDNKKILEQAKQIALILA